MGYYIWPWGPQYIMEEGSIFIVNGEVQDINYPASICLMGFKGYTPALGLFLTKCIAGGRIRVLGICDQISIY